MWTSSPSLSGGNAGETACATTRGSALLTVLWLCAALSAIALSMALTVRGETERVSTEVDGLRGYYLAAGAVDRAAVELLWSVRSPDARLSPRGSAFIDYRFPSGDVHVEFIPETAKLNLNRSPIEELTRLMVALGIDPGRAQQIAAGIAAVRSPSDSELPGPSFSPRLASFQETEDLLLVKGVTPDIFYGAYVASADHRLVRHAGLADCLSVYGATERVDANTADPAVLAAVGLSPYAVSALVARRRTLPLTDQELRAFLETMDAGTNRLRVEGNSIVTIRATARLRLTGGQLGDLKRTVAAQVKYMPPGYDSPIHILRWYDTAWSN